MPVIINGDTGITQPNEFDSDSTFGFKNRIINGGMVIDQRNAGASVTPTDGSFTLDRWKMSLAQTSKLSVQRSTVAPTGFTNSLLVTSLSAYSLLTGDTFGFYQPIEGFNTADLGFGTANAQPVTVSFWVRASLTGTYSVALYNGAANRSCVIGYTVNAANTWEQKSVTFTGDTSGTWLTDNGAGIQVRWDLGSGATFGGATSGVWNAGLKVAVTGQTNVVGTNGATCYITGVQLEKGSTATSFDFRDYGRELMMCQRYFESSNGAGGVATGTDAFVVVTAVIGRYPTYTYKVGKRSTTTLTATFAGGTGATFIVGQSSFYQQTNHSADSTFGWTASAEL